MPRPTLSAPRLAAGLSLLLLLGGAAGAAGETDAAAARAAEGKAAEAETDQPPAFVSIEGLQVSIIDADEMSGRLRVEIVLQAGSPEALATLRRDLPLFRDRAFAAAMEHARLHVSPYAAVDAVKLSAALDSALDDPAVQRVLIIKVSAEPA
jgi:hypothetical protein